MDYLYILENEFIPDLVKVGWTSRTPNVRAGELTSATGVPGEFKILKSFPVTDGSSAEIYVYTALAHIRIGKKEFLRLSSKNAIEKIREILTNGGFLSDGSGDNLHELIRHILVLRDSQLATSKDSSNIDQDRVTKAVTIFHDLSKKKTKSKIIDYYWEKTRYINGAEISSSKTKEDYQLLFDLFISGYAGHLERLANAQNISTNKLSGTTSIVKWYAQLRRLLAYTDKTENNSSVFQTYRSSVTYRDVMESYVSKIERYMRKTGIDWIPINLSHSTVDFNNYTADAKNYLGNVLFRFGFKACEFDNRLEEGGTTQLPNRGRKHSAMFKGAKYELEWLDGPLPRFVESELKEEGWIYDWENIRESRYICIVLVGGKVAHASGRESLNGNSKGLIRVLGG